MRSIPVAMTWEMLSRGRWSLIGAALAAIAFPTIVLGALHRVGAFESGDQSQITIHMVMVQISMFVFAAGVFAAQGAPARLFALPVTTSSLVLWQMLPAMAVVSLHMVLSVVLLATDSFPQQALPEELTWWYFPATLIGPWIVVTMLTSVGLTGRSHLFVQLMFALLTPFFGLLFLSSLLSRQSNSELAHGLGISCGVVFILGTAWGFRAAHRRSLIGSPMVCAASAAWLVLSALVGLAGVLRPGGPISVFVFVIGLAALAVAPFATAPLAVAWNRNR